MKNMAIEAGARLLKAMGNEKRLKILFYLREKEYSVGELEKLVGLSQSALSQHLAVLRAAKIVKTRRAAQTIFYSILSEKALRVLALLDGVYNRHYKTTL